MTFPASSPLAPPGPFSDDEEETEEPTPSTLGPMTDEEIESALDRMLNDARSYQETLSAERAIATDRYTGQPFGNEEVGRSQFIASTTRDAITKMLPPLMRMFWGPERPGEFIARTAEAVPHAEEATAFIADIVMQEDNNGLLETHSALKDGLLKKIGVAKFWWDDTKDTQAYSEEYLMIEQVMELEQEKGVEIQALEKMDAIGGVDMYKVQYTHYDPQGIARFQTLPPEEFGHNRNARSIEDALVVYHVTQKTSSELLALGLEEEEIREHGGLWTTLSHSQEELARNPWATGGQSDETGEWQNEEHTYLEAYPYLDVDGDGITELRKMCLLGPGLHVCNGEGRGEPVAYRPFVVWSPNPEPHTMQGSSVYDETKDLEKLDTSLIRAILDSAAMAAFPRTWYVPGVVNALDILSNAVGQPIRTEQPNALGEFRHEFTGGALLPLLQMSKAMREERTGVSGAFLDPESLQSTTKSAVDLSAQAAQSRLELIARLFAESFMKPLMKGLLMLVREHTPRARMIRLRGQYTEVDPRQWTQALDVRVNVALGMGTTQQRMAALSAIKADQDLILKEFGPNNPLVTIHQAREVRAQLVQLAGFKDASKFYQDVPADFKIPPPPPPPPAPEMLLAQIEGKKAEAAAQHAQQKLALDSAAKKDQLDLDRWKAEMENDRAERQLAADVALKERELALKYMSQNEESKTAMAMKLEHSVLQSLKAGQAPPGTRVENIRLERGPDGRVAGMTRVMHHEAPPEAPEAEALTPE